jgi:hypothetical protein
MKILFTPSYQSVYSFNCELDGKNYIVNVPYNVYRENYYINIVDTFNNLVLSRPLVGSPLNYDINLLPNTFTSTLVFRQPTQQFEILP